MKRREFLPALLLVALLLAGCAGQAPAADGTGAERGAPAETASVPGPEAAPGGEPLSAAQIAAAPRPLSEEEIVTAYNRAVTAYGWFVLTPLPDTGEVVLQDGAAYRRVAFRGMEELEDLRTYLNGSFSPEVTERLLAAGDERPMYRDIDGALYVTGTGRSRDAGKGAVQVLPEEVAPGEYSVHVTVELLDGDQTTVTGLEYWSFPYVFTGDRWVFTDFRLVY